MFLVSLAICAQIMLDECIALFSPIDTSPLSVGSGPAEYKPINLSKPLCRPQLESYAIPTQWCP
jgi:hypothetical protein